MNDGKKITLRFRAINCSTFRAIRDGRKTVETRAASVRYRNVSPSDVLVLVCGKKRLEKKIRRVAYFKTLDAMFRKILYTDISPDAPSLAAARQEYDLYTGYREKIKKYGLMAFYL